MPLLSVYILGVFAASAVMAAETTTDGRLFYGSSDNYTTEADSINNVTIFSNSSSMNMTNSTMTTMTKVDKNSTNGSATTAVMLTATTLKPMNVSTVTKHSTRNHKSTTPQPQSTSDSTGIIILVIIILVAVLFAIACYVAQKRGRRYSVDFSSRPVETNIPLSAVEPQVPAETAPLNGIQVFDDEETPAKETQEAAVNPEEQKAEPDKSVTDPGAESAAPDTSEPGDTTEGVVEQQSPPAPVEADVEEKTDDEGVVPNQTSEESLKETNENNNSNNADSSQRKDSEPNNIFWEVLDCPV